MEYDVFPWEDGDDNLLSQSKNHQDAMLTDSNDFLSLIRIIVNQATRSGSLSKAYPQGQDYQCSNSSAGQRGKRFTAHTVYSCHQMDSEGQGWHRA